jgi:hypothetical protein
VTFMAYDNQKIRFGYKQYASSELFNNFSSEVWEDFQNSNADLFSNGVLNENQFSISVISVGSPSYINVGNGVGYSSGNRIYIGAADTVTYDTNRPLNPQFPQSTGRINIPIPTRDVTHYVWIRHIWTVDPSTSGINRSGSVIYYRWENGYEITVSTSVTPPATGYLLLGNVLVRSDNSYSIGYAGRPYINLNINIYSVDYKSSCFAATTSDVNATYDSNTQTFIANSFGTLTVDGVAPAIGQRVLVKDQSLDPEHNGIYVVVDAGSGASNWIMQRANDANSSQFITNGMYTYIGSGTTHGSSGWVLVTPDPITLDTTPLYFDLYSLKSVIGTGAPGQLTYWTDTDKIGGANNTNWDSGSNTLSFSNSNVLLASGSFGRYDVHPTFTLDTHIVDKKYVDDLIISATSVPGGMDTSVQFNASGVFDGDSHFTYDYSARELTVPRLIVTSGSTITGPDEPGESALVVDGGTGAGCQAAVFTGHSTMRAMTLENDTGNEVLSVYASGGGSSGSSAAYIRSDSGIGCSIYGEYSGLLVQGNGTNIGDCGLGVIGNHSYIAGSSLNVLNGGSSISYDLLLTITDGGILATGGTETLQSIGAGTKFIWYPLKNSFRAGEVTGDQWDDGHIGSTSFAFGYDVLVSASYGIGFGRNLDVLGEGSFGVNLGSDSETLSDANTFGIFGGKAQYGSHPTFTNDTELVDKKYVDDLVVSATGIPGGSNTSVQFNNSGVFGGDSNFVYSSASGIMSIGNSPPGNGVINIGNRVAIGNGLSIDVGSGSISAATFSNNTSNSNYPTIRITNADSAGLAGLFSGILETNKLRLSTSPGTGSLLYSSNASGDAAWAASLTWNNSTTTLTVPSLIATAGIQITGAGFGTGPWQWATTDFTTFDTAWTDGIPAIVTGCPPDNSTQLAIKVSGTIKLFQTIDLI